MEQEVNRMKKMAEFILEMRKAKGLTQKELAARLGVTDKAVSKWERGVSSPDISLIIPLAEALGVSAGELLNGEKEEAPIEERAETYLQEALKYSHKSASQRVEKLQNVFFAGLSAMFLLGAAVCLICDFAVSGTLTWSLIVLVSLFAAWGVLVPLFKAQTQRIRKSLLVISFLVFPYLAVLRILLKVPLLCTMGMYIAAAGLLGVWGIYFIIVYQWNSRKYFVISVICLILAGEEYGINCITDAFLGGTAANSASWFSSMVLMLLLSFLALCFGLAGHFRH